MTTSLRTPLRNSVQAITRVFGLLLALATLATACGFDTGSNTSALIDEQNPAAQPAASAPTAVPASAPAEPEPAEPAAPEEAPEAAPAMADDGTCARVDDVTLQLQWFTQAQFAGYYAALDRGDYAERCLNVTILEGGLEIVPQEELASGAADFAISWVPRALQSREAGLNIVNIGQIFQRSGTMQVALAETGIENPEEFGGRTIGSWGFGLEAELFAGARLAGLEPGQDFEVAAQNFDMDALISGEIDAAQAMIYNEYALVLETINPATGELFTADDLTVINWNDEGTAMLQDAIWADGTRLGDPVYEDIATRFVAASIEGWAWCRDQAGECVQLVIDNGAQGESHQTWQLNEINGLIWPSPDGAAVINQRLWDQTVFVATSEGVIAEVPESDAFTNKYALAALDLLTQDGIDTTGQGFVWADVTLNEGGN